MGKNRDFSKFPNAITVLDNGSVGINQTNPSYKLHVSNNTNGFISRFTGGTSSDVNIGIFGSTAGAFGSIGTESNHPFNIFTNGIDRMSINSGGGVNIGSGGVNAFSNGLTSFNLDMATVGLFSYSAQLYLLNNTYHNGSTGFYYKYTGSGVGGMVVENAGNITFVTAPSGTAGNLVTLSTRMIISETGNVAIGTSSPQRLLDVRGTVNLSTTAPTVSATSGAYADIHLRTFSGASSSPARISVVDNWIEYVATFTDGHRFRNYSSNGVLRELMNITSTGNVGIGTAGPVSTNLAGSLTIVKSYSGDTPTSTTAQNYYNNQSNLYLFGRNAGLTMVGNANEECIIAFASPSSDYLGAIRYETQSTSAGGAMKFQTGGANERMRITSAGLVGIGTSSPLGSAAERTLHLSDGGGGYATVYVTNNSNSVRSIFGMQSSQNLGIVGSQTNTPFAFFTNDTERMRISSNGNVGVGTTLSTYRMQIAKVSTAAPALMISGAFYGGPRIQTYGLDADANAWMGLGTDMGGAAYEHSLYYSTNGRQTMGSYDGTTYTTRFYMLANGNYLFSGTNLSDIRLKENIESITLTASEKIALLNPCSYNMKDDLSVTRYGFIAQEVQNILPDLIRGGSDKHEDYMGLDYDGVFTITVKAVQEILVRLKALENK